MLPGEKFFSPDVYVVVHNNYSHDIQIQFVPDVPSGVNFDLASPKNIIPSKKSIRVPISVNLDNSVVPETYTIGISVDVMPNFATGIKISGSAQMRTKLTVFGEASYINIHSKTASGSKFPGQIYLFHHSNNEQTFISNSNNGLLKERVIPGDYWVYVYWDGYEVSRKSFHLEANEKKDIILIAQTLLIEGFAVTPQLRGNGISNNKMFINSNSSPLVFNQEAFNRRQIESAMVSYSLRNIYEPIENAKIILKIYHGKSTQDLDIFWGNQKKGTSPQKTNARLVENMEILSLPFFDKRTQSGRYTYVPSEGWKQGVYRFRIDTSDGTGLSQCSKCISEEVY
jgi:hypothetical protein